MEKNVDVDRKTPDVTHGDPILLQKSSQNYRYSYYGDKSQPNTDFMSISDVVRVRIQHFDQHKLLPVHFLDAIL